jgi:hypothetical protein
MNNIKYPIKIYRCDGDGYFVEKTIEGPSKYAQYIYNEEEKSFIIVPDQWGESEQIYSTDYKKTLKESIESTKKAIKRRSDYVDVLNEQLHTLKKKECLTWSDPWNMTEEQRDLDEQMNGDDDRPY